MGSPPVAGGPSAQGASKAGNFCICDVIENIFDPSRESDITSAYWPVSLCSIMGNDHYIMTTCHIGTCHHLSQWRPASMMLTTITLHKCWYKDNWYYTNINHMQAIWGSRQHSVMSHDCHMTSKISDNSDISLAAYSGKQQRNIRISNPCKGKPPVTNGFPVQGVRNAEMLPHCVIMDV